ncbi:MAG TPA: magnesium transporter [candidate division Zixibacteria bacterium]|nr:magnesium transporter [candidate division Zixibacteria bacterium]
MQNINPLIVPELREILAAGDVQALRDFCESCHPVIVAEFISALEPHEAWLVLKHAPTQTLAEILTHFEDDFQTEIIENIPRRDFANILTEMAHDERADLVKRLPEESRDAVLPALAQAEREDIRRLISYSEGTAGAVMTSDYATLPPDLTVSQAIDRLREIAPDRETIYYAYVLDSERKLLGFVSLKDLILARRSARVENIMHRDIIFARVDEDQEEAARKIQKYDLLALPVVDASEALVGIITHDDALDIITQEQTEDIEKLMAISGSHEDAVYMKTTIWEHFKNRSPWVMGLAVLGLVSGFIIQNFEGVLLQFAVLAAFMPMLADTGGNTGSQSATLVIRALALKEITPADVIKILWKEFRVSLMLACVLGLIAFGRVVIIAGGLTIPEAYTIPRVGFAIALALALQVVTATLAGALLPLGAAKLKFDPALVASPALTTVVDITGLLIYFTTVKLVLGL